MGWKNVRAVNEAVELERMPGHVIVPVDSRAGVSVHGF